MLYKLSLPKMDYSTIIEHLKSIVYAVILAFLFRSFLFMPFKIPSGSMTPTLLVGDYLFVSKYSYGFSRYSFHIVDMKFINGRLFAKSPQRGDIIVFKSPKSDDDKSYYIKRLIGFPGDEIQVSRGILYINDIAVPKIKIGQYIEKGQYNEHTTIHNIYKEILPNGIQYQVISPINEEPTQFPDETRVYKVPQDHYFFMGDHRNNSIDSRYLSDMGFISEENLIGKAEILFWTRDFYLWKFITQFELGRLFHKL